MSPDVIDLLKQLAARFGVTVEYLWPLLVNYTRWLNTASLVLDIVWILVGLFVLTKLIPLFFTNVRLYNNRHVEGYIDYTYHGVISVLSGLATAACCIFLLITVSGIPSHFVGIAAPEAKAIYDLLAQITATKK